MPYNYEPPRYLLKHLHAFRLTPERALLAAIVDGFLPNKHGETMRYFTIMADPSSLSILYIREEFNYGKYAATKNLTRSTLHFQSLRNFLLPHVKETLTHE